MLTLYSLMSLIKIIFIIKFSRHTTLLPFKTVGVMETREHMNTPVY